jgi:beta-ribofuranosylaminobenzene 5'-phosphate synthase
MGALSGDMEWLSIRAPARLHLGFMPSKNGLGSAAVAISEPSLIMSMRKSDEIHVSGAYSDEFFFMASSFLHSFSEGKGVDIVVESAIRRHIGLGSGTRMALSIGTGINVLYELGLSPYEIAEFFGRGRNSRAGLETLLHGGMAMDDGSGTEILRPPENWRFIVAIPNIDHRFFGELERNAMASMKVPDIEKDFKAEIINAIKGEDIEDFGALLTELDLLTGSMFSDVQGGEHTDERISEIKEFGLKEGAYGAGQSSWGPAVYFLTDEEKSYALLSSIKRFMGDIGGEAYAVGISGKGMQISHAEEYGINTAGDRIVYKS